MMMGWLQGFCRPYDGRLVTRFLQTIWQQAGYKVFVDCMTMGCLQGFANHMMMGWLQGFRRPYDDRLVARFLQTMWRQAGFKHFYWHFWWIGHRVSARGRPWWGGGQGNKPVPQPAADAPAGHHQRGHCQQQGPHLVHAVVRQCCAERTTGRSTHTFLKRWSWWREGVRESVCVFSVCVCVGATTNLLLLRTMDRSAHSCLS